MISDEKTLEEIKKTLRSSHAVMFNVNTIDVELDEDHIPIFRRRFQQESVKLLKTTKDESQQEQ
jgi:hypothetical protein